MSHLLIDPSSAKAITGELSPEQYSGYALRCYKHSAIYPTFHLVVPNKIQLTFQKPLAVQCINVH